MRRLFTVVTLLMTVGILAFFTYIVYDALPALIGQGIYFFVGDKWLYCKGIFGAKVLIVGTVFLTVLTLSMAVPLGVLTGIFLAEYSPKWFSSIARPLVEVLVGIPSVVYGIFGLFVLEKFFRYHVDPLISGILGFIPIFRDTNPMGYGFLLASFVLMIMVLPTIVAITEESIRAVPREIVEGAYALGSTKFEVIRHIIIPVAIPGITAGVILATMRAMGETMAVVMLTGNTMKIPESIFDTGYVITSKILGDIMYHVDDEGRHALMALGLVLFLIGLVFVGITRYLGGRVRYELD